MTQVEFDKKWIAAIKGRSDDKHRREWEASAAIKELKDLNYLNAACQPGVFRTEIFAEVEKYEHFRDWVTKANRAFRNALSDLDQIGKQLLGTGKTLRRLFPSVAIEPICGRLSNAATYVRSRRREIECDIDRFWKKALATVPFESESDQDDEEIVPDGIWGLLSYSATADEEQPNVSTPIGYFESPEVRRRGRSEARKLFPEIQQINKKLDLDRHFQVRQAYILHRAFPELTKSTLARLIVLIYICADLVEYNEEYRLRIKGNRRTFTPDAVYQKIKGLNFSAREGNLIG